MMEEGMTMTIGDRAHQEPPSEASKALLIKASAKNGTAKHHDEEPEPRPQPEWDGEISSWCYRREERDIHPEWAYAENYQAFHAGKAQYEVELAE